MSAGGGDKTLSWRPPAAESRPRLWLLVVDGSSSSRHELPALGAAVIGRGEDADVGIRDELASRLHARIFVGDDGEAAVSDLDSHNGTLVNGERIAGTVELAPGDVIGIGACALVLQGANAPSLPLPLEPRQLRQRLEAEVDRALAFGRPLTVASLALHATASFAELSRTVGDELRLVDMWGLAGETQLVVVMPELDTAQAVARAARLVDRLRAVAPLAAAGVASCPDDGCDAAALLAAARRAAELSPSGTTEAARATTLEVGDRRIIVADPAMSRLYELIRRLARATLPLIIRGETGTGKEHAAFAAHAWSPRAAGPFVALNCAAIPETLVESELFGFDKGAFSGATTARAGKLESASGGTLFLDEVGELPLPAQAKLLRVLEQKKVVRLGETRERPADFRLVAATHRDLAADVRAGRFREDLYFRLASATVVLPPLRERRAELPHLARSFVEAACARDGREPLRLSPATLLRLSAHAWPGNVRELKNALEYAVATATGDLIEPWDLPPQLDSPAAADGPGAAGAPSHSFRPLADELRDLEQRRMQEALAATGGVQKAAAELLGMPIRTFTFKMRQYRLTLRPPVA